MENSLGDTQTTDDFDPSKSADCGPFGIPIGFIPMGTLEEVAGREDAKPFLDRLDELTRANNEAVFRILGRQAL